MKEVRQLLLSFLAVIPLLMYGETYIVDVGQFEKLKVNGNISVVYRNLPDSTGYARYEAPTGNAGIFLLTVKDDGSLKVEPSDDKWGNNELPVIHVYSDFLSSIESYSNLTVDIKAIAPSASLHVKQVGNGTINVNNIKSTNVSASITTGNGSIYLTGKCVNANFSMVGTGLISADRLQADNVKCRILGTGSIGCWPIDNLNVSGLGSTKIYYKGKPNIKKSGGGKLFELPETPTVSQGAELKSLNPVIEETPSDEEGEDAIYWEEEDYKTVVTDDD